MADLKTWNGLAKASVKTLNGLAVASWKTWNGLTIPSSGGVIAFDAASNGQSSGDSWNITATGSNVLLVVAMLSQNTPTSVVYDSAGANISLTAGGTTTLTNGYYLRMYYGYLGTGAGTSKQVTVSGGGDKYCMSATYTGCAQSGQFDSMASSKTTTTVADNCWHLVVSWCHSSPPPTVSGTWINRAASARLNQICYSDSNAAITPAGSNTAGLSVSGAIEYLSASIKPA